MEVNLAEKYGDITPVPQDDGPNPVCAISYPPEYVALMDLFRAFVKSGEISDRFLDLTSYILEINPSNFTIWFYRRKCLAALKADDLSSEFEFLTEFPDENPKNYQYWFHRRAVLAMASSSSSSQWAEELRYTQAVFEADAKNYHSWAHRQWVIEHFNLWEEQEDEEEDFVNSLLASDVLNNSVWNHRWFLKHHKVAALIQQAGSAGEEEEEDQLMAACESILESELSFAFHQLSHISPSSSSSSSEEQKERKDDEEERHLHKLYDNESVWNYIHGWVNRYSMLFPSLLSTNLLHRIEAFETNKPFLRHAAGLKAELYFNEGSKEKAGEVWRELAEKDSVRRKYWLFMLQRLA